ncbi:MAG: response regulator [Paracoccaceae bacterium]
MRRNDEQDSQPLIFIVDDDASMCGALARTIRLLGYRVESFTSPVEFLTRGAFEEASCLITDLIMPDMTGLELQKRLLQNATPVATIFLSGHADVPSTVQAMRDGALDFLEKPVDAGLLEKLLAEGVRHAKQETEARALSAVAHERFESLTERQREVFDGVVAGEPNKTIAHRMGISERTVKAHRQVMMEKMAAGSVADLAFLAMDLGRQSSS